MFPDLDPNKHFNRWYDILPYIGVLLAILFFISFLWGWT